MKYPASQSKSLLDMEVANYCEGLDPSYSTLGFENAEVFYGGGGKSVWMQHAHTRIHAHTMTSKANMGDYFSLLECCISWANIYTCLHFYNIN